MHPSADGAEVSQYATGISRQRLAGTLTLQPTIIDPQKEREDRLILAVREEADGKGPGDLFFGYYSPVNPRRLLVELGRSLTAPVTCFVSCRCNGCAAEERQTQQEE